MSQLQLPHECVKKEQWRMRVLMSGVIVAMMPYCFGKILTQNNLTDGNRTATLQEILFDGINLDININNSYESWYMNINEFVEHVFKILKICENCYKYTISGIGLSVIFI